MSVGKELDFLRDGGDMGARIRAHDWTRHELGDPTHWPQGLKTSLRLMLTTGHPVLIFWGRKLFCFYNDSFAQSLGPEKHPSMLGAPGREYWAEVWPVVGAQLERVLAGDGAVWHEDQLVPIERHGRLEEVYWTYSYSPIDDEGTVGGILVLCVETTRQVKETQRRRLEQERQRRLFEQAPGFVIIMRGPDHVVEFVNDLHKQVFNSAGWIGKPIRDAVPSVEGHGFFELLDEVYASGRAHEAAGAEIRFRRREGEAEQHSYLNFTYAPLLDETGQVAGVFCQGFDATEGERAERRHRLLAHLGDVFREIDDPDEIAFEAAAALGREFNVSRAGYGTIDVEAETITIERDWNAPGIRSLAGTLHFRDYGSYIEDLKRGETVVFADARKDPRTAATAGALEGISALSVVNMPVTEQGGFVALLYLNNATPREWSADELELVREVAERTRTAVERRRAEHGLRRNEARLRFLDALARETSLHSNADAILATTTRMLGQHLGVSVCAYADMEPDEDHFTIRGDWAAEGSRSIVGRYSLTDFGRLAVERLHAGLPLIIDDNRAQLPPEEAATFQSIGLIATICMPLLRQGRLTALMAIHDREARHWSQEELQLLAEVTERSWAHIERVRADEIARESGERLRLATKAASIGTWDYDLVEDVLTWDDRCRALFGLGPDSMVNYHEAFLQGLHPEDRERTDRLARRAIETAGQEPYDVEFRTIGIEDGVERWIAAVGDVIVANGRPVRFIGTVRDITARKRAERHLQTLNDTGASVAAERDLEKIVQTITDAGVELTGAQFGAFFYNVLDENGASYMLYALSGASRSDFDRYPMPRSTAVFEPTFLGTGIVRSDDILEDPRYGRNEPYKGMPKGHLPVRSYLAVPVISRSGQVLGGLFFGHVETGRFTEEHEKAVLGIAGHAATAIDNARLFSAVERELAERRRAEAALQALNATLEERVREELAERARAEERLHQIQKMEAVGQLTGGIAHDFNNMLAVIVGGLNLLQRKLEKGETDVMRFVEGAMDGANRAAALTQRLLAFSRQQPLTPRPLDPNRLVAGMSELLSRTLGETIRVETVLAAGLWRIEADPAQLESAILNLAVNARDAMTEGGWLTIETSNAHVDERYAQEYDVAPGHYVLIAVTDTGEGMTPEIAARAFEPFFTTKHVGKGTGLGLSQVYGFVRQSGGTVKIYSEPAFGTTVKIYLPRHYGQDEELPPQQPTARITGGRGAEIIMVVEDEDRVRAVSAEALRDLGYTVVEAAGPRQALALIDAGQEVSLLFTDVVMPDMSGRELADIMRARLPGLKVLFTTGYTRNAIVHNGVLDHGTQLLTKPFTIEHLARKVRTMLDEE